MQQVTDKSGHWRDLLLMFVFALAIRLWVFSYWWASPFWGYHQVDHGYYLKWARAVAAGDLMYGRPFEQGPLYAYGLAGLFAATGERIDVAIVLQLGLGVVGVVALTAAAQSLLPRWAALATGVVAACYGPWIYFDLLIMKSFLSPLLSVLLLCCLLRFRANPANGSRWLAGAGLCVGLACLIRESHVLLLLAVVIAIWQTELDAGLSKLRRGLYNAMLVLVPLAAVTLPATLHNYSYDNQVIWITAGGGEVAYLAWGPQADGYYTPPDFVDPQPPHEHADFRNEAARRLNRPVTSAESSAYWFTEARRQMANDPARAAWLVGRRLAIALHDYEIPDSEDFTAARQLVWPLRFLLTWGVLLGPAAVGLVVALGRWQLWALPLAVGAAHLLTVALTYNFARFRLGAVPILCLLAVLGAVWIAEAWASRRRFIALVGLAAAIGVSVASFREPPGFAATPNAAFTDRLLAMMYAKTQQPDLARKHALLYLTWSEAQPRRPGDGDPSALRAVALADHCRMHQLWPLAIGLYTYARLRPNSADDRRLLLAHVMSALLQRELEAGEPSIAWRTELQEVLAELCELDPNRAVYWALRCRWVNEENIDELAAGLDRAYRHAAQPSVEDTAWLHVGQAYLSAHRGQRQKAASHVAAVLQQFPEHPLKSELRRLLE